MPLLSETDIPSKVKPLFASAQAREINPTEFCHALKELGIDGIPAMFYVSKAFSLPGETAKKIVIEQEYEQLKPGLIPLLIVFELDREEN